MRIIRVMAVVVPMWIAAGCGKPDCHAFNDSVCNKASQCHYAVCNVDSCPGHENIDFSACINAMNAATCENLEATAFGCYVPRG